MPQFKGAMSQKTGKTTPLLVPTNAYMGTTIVVPITNKQTNKQKNSRDREILRDPWGDFAEIFRVDRGHAYLQKNPRFFF